MRNDTIILFDLNNAPCGSVEMPAKPEGGDPRRIVWQGRTFQEGGKDSFYADCEAGEVPK